MGENDPTIPKNMTPEHGEFTSAKNPSGIPLREENERFGKLSGKSFEATPVGGRGTSLETAQTRVNSIVNEYRQNPNWNVEDLSRERAYVAALDAKQQIYRNLIDNGDIDNIEESIEHVMRDYLLRDEGARNIGDLVQAIRSVGKDREHFAQGTTVTNGRYKDLYENLIGSGADGVADYIEAQVTAARAGNNPSPETAARLRKIQLSMYEKDYLPRTEEGFGNELEEIIQEETRRIGMRNRADQQARPQQNNQDMNGRPADFIDQTRAAEFGRFRENIDLLRANALRMATIDAGKLDYFKKEAANPNNDIKNLSANPELSLKDEIDSMNSLAEVAEIKKKSSSEEDYPKFYDEKLKNLGNDVLDNMVNKKDGVLEAVSVYTTLIHENINLQAVLTTIEKMDKYDLPKSVFDITTLDQVIQLRESMAYWLLQNGRIPLQNGVTQQQIWDAIAAGNIKDESNPALAEHLKMAKDAANVAWEFVYITNLVEDRYSRFNPNLRKAKPAHTDVTHPPVFISQGMHFMMHPEERIETYAAGDTNLQPLTRFDTPLRNSNRDAEKLQFMPPKLIGTSMEYVHCKTKNDRRDRSLFEMFYSNGRTLLDRGNFGIPKEMLQQPDFLSLSSPAFKPYTESEVRSAIDIMNAVSIRGGIKDEKESASQVANALITLDLPEEYRLNILKAGSRGLNARLNWRGHLEVKAWKPLLDNYVYYAPGILSNHNPTRIRQYQTLKY